MGNRSSNESLNLSFEQISFVNGINTYRGGKHVDYIVNQITKKLQHLYLKKKRLPLNKISLKIILLFLLNV